MSLIATTIYGCDFDLVISTLCNAIVARLTEIVAGIVHIEWDELSVYQYLKLLQATAGISDLDLPSVL